MNNRLKQFLLAENISQSQFADTIGVARASISHILSGRNKPGFEFFTSLARHYPTLNLTWLITGKGRMYGNGQPQEGFVAVPSAATADTADEGTVDENSTHIREGLFSEPVQEKQDEQVTRNSGTMQPPSNEVSGHMTGRNAHAGSESQGRTAEFRSPQSKRITKVVIFYDDNTYQEMK